MNLRKIALRIAPLFGLTFVLLLFPPVLRAGFPVVDEVKGLPYPELITVYKDSEDPNLYYFLPTSVAFDIDPTTEEPRFGVQYWGLTKLDPAGAGAALTFTVKPAWDEKKVKSVADKILATNANARFAIPALISSTMDVVINGHFLPKNQVIEKQGVVPPTPGSSPSPTPTVAGPTVDATQAFTISLNNLGARAFSQGVAPASDLLAARYTYKFRGVGKRLHAKITVNYRRVYDHFKSQSSASGWWGLAKAQLTVEIQKLRTEGGITFEVLSGGTTDETEYFEEIFKTLVNQKIAGEGMFRPALQPNGLPNAPEAGRFGWGFSNSTGWERTDQEENFVFEINKQTLEDREFQTGVSFSAVCAKYPNHFVDLTKIQGGCITSVDFDAILAQQAACTERKQEDLYRLYQRGLITKAAWEAKSTKILDEPCYAGVFDGTFDILRQRILLYPSLKNNVFLHQNNTLFEPGLKIEKLREREVFKKDQ